MGLLDKATQAMYYEGNDYGSYQFTNILFSRLLTATVSIRKPNNFNNLKVALDKDALSARSFLRSS